MEVGTTRYLPFACDEEELWSWPAAECQDPSANLLTATVLSQHSWLGNTQYRLSSKLLALHENRQRAAAAEFGFLSCLAT